jgi:hypothetical protein
LFVHSFFFSHKFCTFFGKHLYSLTDSYHTSCCSTCICTSSQALITQSATAHASVLPHWLPSHQLLQHMLQYFLTAPPHKLLQHLHLCFLTGSHHTSCYSTCIRTSSQAPTTQAATAHAPVLSHWLPPHKLHTHTHSTYIRTFSQAPTTQAATAHGSVLPHRLPPHKLLQHMHPYFLAGSHQPNCHTQVNTVSHHTS